MRTMLICVLAIPVAVGCAMDVRPPGQTASTAEPLGLLSGNDSRVTTAGYRLIDSGQQWKEIWLSHLGLKEDTLYRPVAEVDFARCMVVAIFAGRRTNTCGFRVPAVIEHPDMITVRFESIGFQTFTVVGAGGGDDTGGGVSSTPYAFIVLPRSAKPIVLEENVQQYKGQPPEWREVWRLTK